MIPRITYQIYMQGFDALPAVDRARILEFRARNPGWDHRFYDESSAEVWLARNASPAIRTAFHSISPGYHAARADFLRYLLCHAEGGVYLDIKSEATRPLDSVLRPDDSYLISQWPELRDRPSGQGNHADLAHVPGDEFVTWYIVAAARHPFLAAVIAGVLERLTGYSPWRAGVGRIGVLRTTGPIAYTQIIYPMLPLHPHQVVDAEHQLGFRYSHFNDHFSHRDKYGRHYSTLVDPVVQSGWLTCNAARIWYGNVRPEVERTARRSRKLARVMTGRGWEI